MRAGNTLSFLYDDQGMRTRKKGMHGETVYVNQYYTLKNGAITSKHVFAGTSRIASRVITAEQAPRSRELPQSDTSSDSVATAQLGETTFFSTDGVVARKGKIRPNRAKVNRGQAKKGDNDTTDEAIDTDGFPGQGVEHRADRANEVAQNTLKNKHYTGELPNQGNGKGDKSNNGRGPDKEKEPHGKSGEHGGGNGRDHENNGGGNADKENNGNGGSNGNGGGSGGNGGGKGADFLYYYHPDHLGSTGYVTDEKGELYEHIQYLPFGETWEEQSSNIWRTPYKYTSKEIDPETNLYYYGARYYDPRTSVWQSADPILGKHIEGSSKSGGVFLPVNLALFTYGALNPVRFNDPDGQEFYDKTDLTQEQIGSGKYLEVTIRLSKETCSSIILGLTYLPQRAEARELITPQLLRSLGEKS